MSGWDPRLQENKWIHHLPVVGVTVGFMLWVTLRKNQLTKTAAVSILSLSPFFACSPSVCVGWYEVWTYWITVWELHRKEILFIHSKNVCDFSWNHSSFLVKDTWFASEYLNPVVLKLFMLELFTRNKTVTQNRKVIQAVGFMSRCIRLYRSFCGAVFPVAVSCLAGSFYLIVSQRQ